MKDKAYPARCSTCRFFAPEPRGLQVYDPETDEDFETQHHTCVRVVHGNGDDVKVVDGSGYAARLLVLPNFGCILHEEKSPEPKPGA